MWSKRYSRRSHIMELAAELEVDVVIIFSLFGGEPFGEAYDDFILLGFTSFSGWSQEEYFIALHELGHVFEGEDDQDMMLLEENTLESEARAWDWAFTVAQEFPSKKTLKRIKKFLGSYKKMMPFHMNLPDTKAVPVYDDMAQYLGITI